MEEENAIERAMLTTEEGTTIQSEHPINMEVESSTEIERPMSMREENPNQKQCITTKMEFTPMGKISTIMEEEFSPEQPIHTDMVEESNVEATHAISEGYTINAIIAHTIVAMPATKSKTMASATAIAIDI